MNRILGMAVAALLLFPEVVRACEVVPDQTVRVAEVIDAVTFQLDSGAVLRLESLGPPRAPTYHQGDWPMEDDARERVRDLIGSGALRITAGNASDRYGRLVVQAWLPDGVWLNGALAERGLARVETTADFRRCAAELLVLEADAREREASMWRLSAYAVRQALEARAFTNDFQLVEGRVLAVAEVRRRIYVNFGEDWRSDFTVTIAPTDRRRFAEAGLDPLTWAGREIRVRGWLEWYNGPQIEASHPEQIEFLGGDTFDGAIEDQQE